MKWIKTVALWYLIIMGLAWGFAMHLEFGIRSLPGLAANVPMWILLAYVVYEFFRMREVHTEQEYE